MLIRLGPKLFRPILIWFGPFFVWSRYFPPIWIWSGPLSTEPDLVGIFYPPIWIWSEPFTTDSDLFSTDLEVVQPFFLIRIWSGTFFIKSRSGQGYSISVRSRSSQDLFLLIRIRPALTKIGGIGFFKKPILVAHK